MKTDLITINISTPIPDEGPHVSIQWEGDHPEIFTSDLDEEWDEGDQAWTKLCNAIHAFLAALGPFPPGGWDVKFKCPHPELIIEKGLTPRQYRNRNSPNPEK